MVKHGDTEIREAVADPTREWGVYRCAHGCVHLVLDRVTVTLTGEEFDALETLLRRARHQFSHTGPIQAPVARAH
jgi:hypothetical protein